MSFYTCFDWFKKLSLFVNVWNLKINVVLKASSVVVIGWFSLNEAPLGLIKIYFRLFALLRVRSSNHY